MPRKRKTLEEMEKALEAELAQVRARREAHEARKRAREENMASNAKIILGGMVGAAVRAGRITPEFAWEQFGPAARTSREKNLVRWYLGLEDLNPAYTREVKGKESETPVTSPSPSAEETKAHQGE